MHSDTIATQRKNKETYFIIFRADHRFLHSCLFGSTLGLKLNDCGFEPDHTACNDPIYTSFARTCLAHVSDTLT